MKFKFRKVLVLLLVTVMAFTVLTTAASAETRFSDAEGWSAPYIEELANRGIIHGYPDGTVRPDNVLSQGEYAALLCGMAEIDPADSATGHWAAKYADALIQAGIVPEEEYNADAPMTRMELIAWTIRAIGGEELTEELVDSGFSDTEDCTEEELGYLALSKDSGLICGYPDGTARPASACTRGESFAVLCRYEEAESYVAGELAKQEEPIPVIYRPAPKKAGISATVPSEAYTGEPVEVTVQAENTERYSWSVAGRAQDWAMTSENWDDRLSENGTITFYMTGDVTLTLTAVSALDGEEIVREYPIKVTERPIRLVPASTTASLWGDFYINAEVRSDVTASEWEINGRFPTNGEIPGVRGSFESVPAYCYFDKLGTYEFTLKGTDGEGNPVSGSCAVTVPTPEGEPLALSVLGADPAESVTVKERSWVDFYLNCRADVTDVVWSASADSLGLQDSRTDGASIYFHDPGTYTISASGKDGYGAPVSASMTVVVEEIPIPEGEAITITAPEKATATDPWEVSVTLRSDVTDVQWAMPNTAYEGTLNAQGGTLTFANAGDYTLALSGKDAKGDPVSKSVTVTVEPLPPVRIIAPTTATVNQPWIATVQATHHLWDSGMIVECGDGYSSFDGWLGNDGGTLTFFAPGTYTITLSGRDDNWESVSGSITVEVQPEPIELSVTGADTAVVNEPYSIGVTRSGSILESYWAITRDGQPSWDFSGDLFTSCGSVIWFTLPGNYEFTLTGLTSEGTISDSFTVEVSGTPVRELWSPTFAVPEAIYTETDTEIIFTGAIPSETTLAWSCQREEIAVSYSGELGTQGGTVQFPKAGTYTLTATVSDEWGNQQSYSQTFTVLPKPHIRMNPLSPVTFKERMDYVYILHMGTSSSAYPELYNADGMSVTFSLLEDGQPASEDTAYFSDNGAKYANQYSYTFQPRKLGDYVVRATLADDYGNSFTFDARYKVVENVYVSIVDYEETATVGTALSVSTESHGRTDEAIRWSLEKIEGYEAKAEAYGWRNQESFRYLLEGWETVSMDEYATYDLTDAGGSICFKEPGLYCLKTSVTDQYDYTNECYAVIYVTAQS